MRSEGIKVVYADDTIGIYRAIIYNYETSTNDQIQLPKNFYSKGYYERLSDGLWNQLPWLPLT